MTDRGRELIGNEFTRLLQDWYQPTEELAPAEVQVYGGDARLVIGKMLEEFALIQAKYKLLAGHLSLLENGNSSKLVPGYDPGHTLGTGDQELHSKHQQNSSQEMPCFLAWCQEPTLLEITPQNDGLMQKDLNM
ncbi:hypothetical protein DSO57_1033624 [Entomophthora muscae]|uniref:Uncharacterized protein n=1 Tax=Entomophthora muscae TaxID=34485 RepID=A0ACC2SZZ1_9FUNG|nr:hypothetical protein DSO57_1033624 [Entomophthora muscae]